ncbi:MAG: hypothetical protein F6K63_14720 [Moorea sp. SIO1G6]|uniref:hypothetical protein n=1 Tax=Moorena sp. SIO1G6 TaxID=2607840 RepID=UPI0013BF5755|nr:hypothetical protein [Moorena sp. SIO1G6]NES86123.1 hypothetical protein [Moorena sp. SIO2B7]NET65568.1 hypothetical protein [Moorena sp. SIO1G6]
MSNIKINDIKPSGAELFDDPESFLDELTNNYLQQIMGGLRIALPPDARYIERFLYKIRGKFLSPQTPVI